MNKAILIPGKEKRVYSRHPWIFRSDIARTEGDPYPGEVVDILSSRGRFLARGFYNPASQIALRIMTWREEPVDRAMIFRRVKEAVDYRRNFADLHSCRLIFAESDRLPALIVDSFGDDQSAMLWVSVCRTYQFVSDLSANVLRDSYGSGINI